MSAPTWTKLPALDGRSNPCLCCPAILATAPLNKIIAVGFGDAHASRDGEEVYREPSASDAMKVCPSCGGDWAEADGTPGKPLCGTCAGAGMVDDPDAPRQEYWDFEEVEKLAAADPDHDWRIVLYGPLHGEVYQRHDAGVWNLVEKNEGFA